MLFMRKYLRLLSILLSALIWGACSNIPNNQSDDTGTLYPRGDERKVSRGNTTYFIDPVKGSDNNTGLKGKRAWLTFRHLNQLKLSPGDKVEILSPGKFDQTIFLQGAGTDDNPVEINFAPGRYDIFPDNIYRDKYNISNTNSMPDSLKAVGILLKHAKNFNINGNGAKIVYRAKMIEVCIDSSTNININNLKFDYHRPTVSEFRVMETGDDYAIIKIHEDSWYKTEGGKIIWYGEGWTCNTRMLGQELNPETNDVRRLWDPLEGLEIEQLGSGTVRARGKHRLKVDHIYQLREIYRDYAAVFTRRSKNITWDNVDFYFMHGMGMVSQFSEDLALNAVRIAPETESGRTTAAWADCLHFSGCRGKIQISDCVFKGAHDDAINIHGTYLQVAEILPGNQLLMKFVHEQTYGFMAFNAGDQVDLIDSHSYESYGLNRVTKATMINPREILITLEDKVPINLEHGDVIENVTWTPEVEIKGCSLSWIPTRGFLISTRRRTVVENNDFLATHMSAILMAIDANNWFESGFVRDMLISGNNFIRCAEPVILIEPGNSLSNKAVYQNISIMENDFLLRGSVMLRAKSTSRLKIIGNSIYSNMELDDQKCIITDDCEDVTIDGNKYESINQ
jgi:hypothetical protein